MTFLDICKAYNGVWWDGLVKGSLVEEKLVRVCEGLHDGVETRVILDGAHSRWFTVETGLRQSCPLSPLLFMIYVMGMEVELEKV